MDKELVCQYCHKNPKEEGSNYCVDCHARIRLHNKEWYHTHKEYAKERVRKWRESHKEEGLRKVRDYRRTLKIKIIETMGGKCMHCGYDKNYAVLRYITRILKKKKELKIGEIRTFSRI